jgi:hypothetical protein
MIMKIIFAYGSYISGTSAVEYEKKCITKDIVTFILYITKDNITFILSLCYLIVRMDLCSRGCRSE